MIPLTLYLRWRNRRRNTSPSDRRHVGQDGNQVRLLAVTIQYYLQCLVWSFTLTKCISCIMSPFILLNWYSSCLPNTSLLKQLCSIFHLGKTANTMGKMGQKLSKYKDLINGIIRKCFCVFRHAKYSVKVRLYTPIDRAVLYLGAC